MASVRMQSLRLHYLLEKNSYQSTLIQCPDFYTTNLLLTEQEISVFCEDILTEGDIVVIHKLLGKETELLCKYAKKVRANVAYITCDMPLLPDYQSLIDLLVVPSRKLVDLYEQAGYTKVALLEDVPEVFIEPLTSEKSSVLRCVWFGIFDEEKWESYLWLKRLLKEHFSDSILIESISDVHFADHKWQKNSFKKVSENYDLVLLPTKEVTLDQNVKSSNKLLQSMALGLPVLVSPLKSYEYALSAYEHDIICQTDLDWITKTSRFFNREFRSTIGHYNYSFVRSRYSSEAYVTSFLNIIPNTFHKVDKTSNTHFKNEKQLASIKESVYLKGMNVERLFEFKNVILLLKNTDHLNGLFFRSKVRITRKIRQVKHMWFQSKKIL